jgi:hypothetical protein
MEFAATRTEDVALGMIVEAAPAVSGPRPSGRNIAIVAEDGAGIPAGPVYRADTTRKPPNRKIPTCTP